MRPRLLITRSAELARPLVLALTERQLDAACVPVTQVAFGGEAATLPELSNFDWIAFTSANGARGFARLLRAAGTSLCNHCQIACLGEATAEVARRELLRDVDFIGTSAHGRAFAESLLAQLGAQTNVKLLYPGAEVTLPGFQDTCRAAGLDVTNLPVYQTQAVAPAQLRAELQQVGSWQTVIFYAPSAVSAFAAAFASLRDVSAIAIGSTTAQMLAEHGCTRIWTSDSPALDDVVATVSNALAAHPIAPTPEPHS